MGQVPFANSSLQFLPGISEAERDRLILRTRAGLERARHRQTGNAVGRYGHAVAFQLQLELIEIRNIRMIFNHQHARLGWHELPQGNQA